MIRQTVFVQIILFLFASCKAQTDEHKIEQTANKIISIIEKGSVIEFESLIGVKLSVIGKDKDMLLNDFEECQKFYTVYMKGKKPKIQITDNYNYLGNRLVIIPFFEGADSISNISKVQIQLFFGPPNFVSLDKISNYEVYIQHLEESIPVNPIKKFKKME